MPGAPAAAAEAHRAAWEEQLGAVHWDSKRQQFADVTGCTGDRASDRHHSGLVGYVNLYPVLTMALDDGGRALTVIRAAREELLGDYGLQSLSNSSRRLLKDAAGGEQHAGPVWLHANFMMLRALHAKYIGLVGEEAESLYHELRGSLVGAVSREFARTGKLWESYDAKSGRGLGAAPFNAWSALVVAIMAEQY